MMTACAAAYWATVTILTDLATYIRYHFLDIYLKTLNSNFDTKNKQNSKRFLTHNSFTHSNMNSAVLYQHTNLSRRRELYI